jgi:hypothetical protein
VTLKARLKKARRAAAHHGRLARAARKRAATLVRRIRAGHSGPDAACKWALEQARDGVRESPPFSNRGPRITDWQQAFGSWLVGQAWCGVFVGTALKRHGGVVGIDSRVASVALIEDDARGGRHGWRTLVAPHAAKRGDAVVLFGRGVHVELVLENHGTYLRTVGGNTSPGSGGSQSNGGGVYVRDRPMSAVHCVCRPNWP